LTHSQGTAGGSSSNVLGRHREASKRSPSSHFLPFTEEGLWDPYLVTRVLNHIKGCQTIMICFPTSCCLLRCSPMVFSSFSWKSPVPLFSRQRESSVASILDSRFTEDDDLIWSCKCPRCEKEDTRAEQYHNLSVFLQRALSSQRASQSPFPDVA
jgi:hypothetical protein